MNIHQELADKAIVYRLLNPVIIHDKKYREDWKQPIILKKIPKDYNGNFHWGLSIGLNSSPQAYISKRSIKKFPKIPFKIVEWDFDYFPRSERELKDCRFATLEEAYEFYKKFRPLYELYTKHMLEVYLTNNKTFKLVFEE